MEATILNPGSFEPMDLNDLLLADDEFSFSLVNPGGQAIDCNLYQLDDESFRGECTDGGGEAAEMTLGAFER